MKNDKETGDCGTWVCNHLFLFYKFFQNGERIIG